CRQQGTEHEDRLIAALPGFYERYAWEVARSGFGDVCGGLCGRAAACPKRGVLRQGGRDRLIERHQFLPVDAVRSDRQKRKCREPDASSHHWRDASLQDWLHAPDVTF